LFEAEVIVSACFCVFMSAHVFPQLLLSASQAHVMRIHETVNDTHTHTHL